MTADLIARCRTALAESDETAKAATRGIYGWRAMEAHQYGKPTRYEVAIGAGNWQAVGPDGADLNEQANTRHIAANDPSTRLAHNRALRTVLDGIAATLAEHDEIAGFAVCARCHENDAGIQDMPWPCSDHRRATASLAAIAEALGVKEES